ncbi:6-aminohexanoate hydrolase [Kineobactrum sediminis]|uniref:6-aminohexanoate hydrolase n=2 Tax=Kineobactrum sediminis TaxID=1905677 RepID=A0A2N5Y7U0_9GAMM|nr:6-aminohexanoate hydrolase [Kineobactrum sediminis]
MLKNRLWIAATVITVGISGVVMADTRQDQAAWMEGFPPPQGSIIRNSDRDFFSFPKLTWSVCHLRQLLPTKAVSRGLAAPVPFEYRPDRNIDQIEFRRSDTGETMSWAEAYTANHTDGLIVLHKGKVLYERYSGCLDELGKHAIMSMTKSIVGLMAEILIAEGVLDEHALAGELVPELKAGAFGNATLRQILNMTTGLKYSEDYTDPKADVWVYNEAASPLPKPPGFEGPRSYFEYLQTIEPEGQHGEAFAYKTINVDAVGWIIARATGKSIAELLSERIWQKIGAEQEAYFTIDSIGTPFAGGGLSGGLRDLARIGQLMLDEGSLNGEQLIPKDAIKSITAGANPEDFAKAGYDTIPNGSYKSLWWLFHNDNGAYAARGVHGQTIYIDPTAQMVIVRFASHPTPGNAANDPTSLPAYQALADYLLN